MSDSSRWDGWRWADRVYRQSMIPRQNPITHDKSEENVRPLTRCPTCDAEGYDVEHVPPCEPCARDERVKTPVYVERDAPPWRMAASIGTKWTLAPVYGVEVARRVLGPLEMGVAVQTNRSEWTAAVVAAWRF